MSKILPERIGLFIKSLYSDLVDNEELKNELEQKSIKNMISEINYFLENFDNKD